MQLRGFDLKVRFDGSIAPLLDAGGWLGLSAGGWLMLSQLWWLRRMLVQKGCWLASMLCLGSHTLDALRGRRISYQIYREGSSFDFRMVLRGLPRTS